MNEKNVKLRILFPGARLDLGDLKYSVPRCHLLGYEQFQVPVLNWMQHYYVDINQIPGSTKHQFASINYERYAFDDWLAFLNQRASRGAVVVDR